MIPCDATSVKSGDLLRKISPQTRGFFSGGGGKTWGKGVRRYLWLATKFYLLLASTAPIQPCLFHAEAEGHRED